MSVGGVTRSFCRIGNRGPGPRLQGVGRVSSTVRAQLPRGPRMHRKREQGASILNDRKRHEHMTERGRVIRFAVQYETFAGGEWRPVVRYDTAHGFPHIDRSFPDGRVEKIPLLVPDLGDALTLADDDIDENWPRYKEEFLKGWRGHD